jgi:SAM-dependent methyltransferase
MARVPTIRWIDVMKPTENPVMFEIWDCQCTACGQPTLITRKTEWTSDRILAEAIACVSCGATFDVIWGVPFLGHYEADDIAGLVEIAANAREDNAYATRQDVERVERLLQRYHDAVDRSQFLTICSDDFARAPWFANRYTEYSAFRSLTSQIEFVNREVLDVGAGTGYDTWRLVQRGGRVTAFEYNPVLIRRGRSVVPEARWIGGFAHGLPFQSEKFDIVCCNAALHHMRDVRGAMHEMLRVLRHGGWLLTTGDPFRSEQSPDETELDVFDEHPDVLLGVNESIPRLQELVETLALNEDRLSIRLLTSSLVREREGWFRRLLRPNDLSDYREWSFSKRKRLSTASGNISIRAQVRKPLYLIAKNQGPPVLPAGEYATVLDDYDLALGTLAPILPSYLVDRPFPGDRQTKFELLNGWQKPVAGKGYRTAYKRARWFLTRPPNANALRFSAKAEGGRIGSLEVRLAGQVVAKISLTDAWSEAVAPLTHIQPATRFVCEMRVIPSEIGELGFDDYRFGVKDRQFVF